MFGVDHFYHERVRKSVAIFGSIFNDAYIIRRSGNKVVSQQRVPIAYAPKRKFLERISDMYQAGKERGAEMLDNMSEKLKEENTAE